MSDVKFPALTIGQRFLWRGTLYTKTSPLLARAEDSGQAQMIPRSALVQLTDSAKPQPTATASAEQVLNDLQAQTIHCLETLAKDCSVSTKALTQARKQLQTAFQQALTRLHKTP